MINDYGRWKTDQMIENLESKLAKEYKRAAIEVEQKAKKHWADFERKDARKRRMLADKEITKKEYIEWRRNQFYIETRWQEMSRTLAQDYVNTNQIASALITDNNFDVFALNHNYGAFEIETVTKTDLSYTLYNRKTVEALAKNSKNVGKLKTAMKVPVDLRWNERQLNSAMLQGLLQGESIGKIAHRLPRAVAEKNYNGAVRRARTLSTYAQNLGREEMYREARGEYGIDVKKQWLATLDGRTRHEHRALDGEIRDLDEQYSNGLMEPGDPNGAAEEIYNCRCSSIPYLPKYSDDYRDLTKRNVEHLETDYEDWKQGKSKQYYDNEKFSEWQNKK